MEKHADSADISMLFFLIAVLIFWLYTRKQTVLFCTVLLALYYQYCAVSTVLLARCYEHCAFNTVLLALCYQHCAISTVLLALCYQHCAKSSVLLRCFSTTWFNSGEFTLFWRALQNVAKYAFFVLLFWARIFIRAIFYAFSISGDKLDTSLAPPGSISLRNNLPSADLLVLDRLPRPQLRLSHHGLLCNLCLLPPSLSPICHLLSQTGLSNPIEFGLIYVSNFSPAGARIA